MPDKIFRNILTGLLALATNVVVGFLMMPFIVNHIGLTGFGIWMLVNTLVGYMGLLDVGLGPTLVKKSAELLATKDVQALNRIISIFFVLYLLIGSIIGVAVVTLSPVAPHVFNVPAESISEFQAVFWILGLQVAVSFPMSIWIGLLGGLQAYHIQNSISTITTLTKAAGTFFLLQAGSGLVSLIWLGFALAGVGWLIAMFSVKRRIPYLRVDASHFGLGQTKEIAQFSGVMFIGGLSWKTLFESARIIIGLFQRVASGTIYEVGLSICLYSRNLFYVMSVIMPSAAHLYATSDKEGLRGLYLTGTKYSFAVYSAIVIALFMFGKQFIFLWMGKGFEESVWIMYVLSLGSLFQSQNLIANYLLMGMNNLAAMTRVAITYSIVIFPLNILFVFYWGLIGAALATTNTIVLVETYFLLKIVGIFEIRLLSLIRLCHLPSVLPATAGV